MYDVAIVGAGPAGSRMACRVAGAGHRVVVLDKKKHLDEPVCCTGIIGQECVDLYDFGEDVIYRQANSAKIFSPSGKLLRVWREKSQASIVDRAALNRSLAARAEASGAEYRLSAEVKDIERRNDRVSIKVSCGSENETVEVRAVVIAAGFGSKLVGQSVPGRVGDFAMGVQAEVEAPGLDEVEVYLGGSTAPGFFAWLVPTAPGKALAGLISRRSPGDYTRKFVSALVGEGKILTEQPVFSYGGVPLKPPAKTYADRTLVVGGAAGQVKPITGGGVYYGLLCADIASDCLHRALENDNLSARALAAYQKEWKKKLGREIAVSYRARKFYERLSDRQIDRIFDIVCSAGIDKTLLEAEDLSFDWHGGVVMRLIGQGALSQVLGALRIPFTRKPER